MRRQLYAYRLFVSMSLGLSICSWNRRFKFLANLFHRV